MIIAMDTATPQLRAVASQEWSRTKMRSKEVVTWWWWKRFPTAPWVKKSGPGNDCYSLLLKIAMYTLW